MAFDTVVAYAYKADIYCPRCTINKVHDDPATPDQSMCINATWMGDAETVLAGVAEARGIDRMDERSYDSDDFPKVIFSIDIENNEQCGGCGKIIE